MLTLFQYVIKISACFTIIYLFYSILLRHLTTYKSNRFYFLVMVLLAFLIPFWKVNVFVDAHKISSSNFISYIPVLNVAESFNKHFDSGNAINISLILLIIFITGIIIFCVRFLLQLISVKKIVAHAELISEKSGIKLNHLNKDIAPFSFANSIYINKHKYAPIELEDIIKHESVHVSQLHIIDVMLAEFVCILNWYNPFVWLIKNAMKQNLEFLADEDVINRGADKKSYQYLLLKVTGYYPLHIATSFNMSSLKRRIYMMNKTRTSKKHFFRLFFVLPLLAITMFAFRNSDANISTASISNVKEDTFTLTELTYNIPDKQIDNIVKKAQGKSLLLVGKPVTISLVMNEKDRLKSLLEKNGYNNISNHAITFLIDTTQVNNSFAVQVNIDLQRKSLSLNNTNSQENKTAMSEANDQYNNTSGQVVTKQLTSKL